MDLGKSRVGLLTMVWAFALSVNANPARGQAEVLDEAAVSAVGMDSDAAGTAGVASTVASTVDVAAKPDAPTPKIDADPSERQDNSSASSSQQAKPTGPPANPTGQQDDNPKRILGFIPNFQTKNDDPGNQPPLTVKQKYILALHQTVDFSAHIGNLFQASLQQAADAQPHYGQGWGPFAERFGAAEGDQATSSFFMFGFLPSVLHDDPRYFRRAKGSIWSRLTYSATRTVVTRRDSGTSTFNIPVVAGFLLQQSISTAYYPPEDRTAGRVFQNWGTSLAFNSAYNVLKEFYPDLLHLAFHRHHHAADPVARPPSSNSSSH
jgi:hypothetical protein